MSDTKQSNPKVPILLTEAEAAQMLTLAPATLRDWRLRHKGPVYVKLGSLVRYREADLHEFADQRKVEPITPQARTPLGLPAGMRLPGEGLPAPTNRLDGRRRRRLGGYRTQETRRALRESAEQPSPKPHPPQP